MPNAGELVSATDILTEANTFTEDQIIEGKATITPTAGTSSLAVVFNEGYNIYVDNTGAGASSDRFWLDTPDNGEVIVGPRSGASFIESLRLRTDATTASAANCFIDSSSQKISRSTSSRRYKDDIQDARIDLDAVRNLRAVKFRDRSEKLRVGNDSKWHVGFIAEEVDELGLSEFVQYRDDDGTPDSVQYDRIVVGLLGIVRELEDRVSELESAA